MSLVAQIKCSFIIAAVKINLLKVRETSKVLCGPGCQLGIAEQEFLYGRTVGPGYRIGNFRLAEVQFFKL